MRPQYNRKTSPKVIGGLVQRKNNHVPTAQRGYVVDRKRPGNGYRHVLKKKDIHDFTDILPDWGAVSEGIEAVVLDAGNEFYEGLYKHYSREGTGVIWLTAWPKDPWLYIDPAYFNAHRLHYDKLNVIYERSGTDWSCHFTDAQAKGFLLLHIFLHEFGHHVDRLRSRKKDRTAGGDDFAEAYANRMFEEVWPAYVEKFGEP